MFEEYEEVFVCSICDLEKSYHNGIFETEMFIVCDECDVSETCINCDTCLSFVEINYLIINFKTFNKCIYCLSLKNKELWNNFTVYMEKHVDREFIDEYLEDIELRKSNYINYYEFKFEKLSNDVNNFLEFTCCKSLNDVKKLILNYKEYILNRKDSFNENDIENLNVDNNILDLNKKNLNLDVDKSLKINVKENNKMGKEKDVNIFNSNYNFNNNFNLLNNKKLSFIENSNNLNPNMDNFKQLAKLNELKLSPDNNISENVKFNNILNSEKNDKIKKLFNNFILDIKKKIIIKRIKKFLDKKHKLTTNFINQDIAKKLVKSIKKYNKITIFDNIYESNRNMINSFSKYYEELIINKKEYYIKPIRKLYDKNHGRFLRLMELYYFIKKTIFYIILK